ncbi:hypothetical protein ER13_03685 [Brevundimonas sp. EAKA]|nr:hypothetical protein ER13_03685 [Brevundimonas sp. EAKA]
MTLKDRFVQPEGLASSSLPARHGHQFRRVSARRGFIGRGGGGRRRGPRRRGGAHAPGLSVGNASQPGGGMQQTNTAAAGPLIAKILEIAV